MSVKITGASDDLIEIEGDISEEWNFYPDNAGDSRLLAFSDGTLLRVNYDDDGIWRFQKVAGGSAQFSKVDGDARRDTPDVVTLSGVQIDWVVFGEKVSLNK